MMNTKRNNNSRAAQIISSLLLGWLIGFAVLALTGCTALSNVTDPDGNPVTPGPVCVDTANGRVCYYPTPVPGTAAIAPAPVVQSVPQLAK